MTVVEPEIHQHKTEYEFKRPRQRDDMNESERSASRRWQRPSRRRLHQAGGCDEGEYRNSEVHKEPRDQRARGVAKRKKALQDEQQCKNCGGDERRWKIIHLRNMSFISKVLKTELN